MLLEPRSLPFHQEEIMKTSRAALLKRTLVVLMVTMLLLIPASAASANVRLPGGATPYYAQIGFGVFFHTDDWVEISFYHDPACIPEDFNLLLLFADTSGCAPTTTGFEIYAPGAQVPKLVELKGLGAVPVWFVNWTAFQEAIEDDVLTIVELDNLNPLKGTADFYHETLRPTAAVKQSTMELNVRGTLSDGRTFSIHTAEADRHGLLKTSIVFK
jgi:hypothetical protein